MTIVISGLTGSGKTTLSTMLSAMTGCTPMRTSDMMLELIGDKRPKSERMIGWIIQPSTAVGDLVFAAGTQADERHAAFVRKHPGGVHESIALPLLLNGGEACRVLLATDEDTRFGRVAKREGVDIDTARLITARKDERTENYMQGAYGISFSGESYLDHFEVVIRPASGMTIIRAIPSEVELLLRTACLRIEATMA